MDESNVGWRTKDKLMVMLRAIERECQKDEYWTYKDGYSDIKEVFNSVIAIAEEIRNWQKGHNRMMELPVKSHLIEKLQLIAKSIGYDVVEQNDEKSKDNQDK